VAAHLPRTRTAKRRRNRISGERALVVGRRGDFAFFGREFGGMIRPPTNDPAAARIAEGVRPRQRSSMSSLKTSSDTKPLSHSVSESLDDYFRSLNGHSPAELYDMVLAQVEPPLLRATLRYCDNNQSRAAEILGLNRATLRKKLRLHRISAKPTR
jgi:Fis family transcriptional regulator